MSERNPSMNRLESLPQPTKTLAVNDTLKGILLAYELRPSDYKSGSDRLVITVTDKKGNNHYVNIALGGGDAYAQIHEIITKTGLGAELDISRSNGYEGRTIKLIKPKP